MEIIVACPNCNYKLHLPSRELLGRRGKCPECEHKFVMQESETVSPPEPQPTPAPKNNSEPKAQPAKPLNDEIKTVIASDATHGDFPAVEAEIPRDPGFASEGGKSSQIRGPAALNAAPGDSALVPEGIWDDIEAHPPMGSSGTGSQRSGVFDVVARCPNCHAGVSFQQDEELRDFLCQNCKRWFSLIDPASPSEAIVMPRQVGAYFLHKYPRIGIGPFGSTYRAKDGQSHDLIAIKVARGDQVSERERKSFLATLSLVMQLKHPNIATLRELDYADGRVYLVSSYINGIDLSDYLLGLKEQKFTARESASLCALVASVLHHGHKFSVVHGNLKPSNIRLDGDRKPYLIDYGLSQRENAVLITDDGRIVGTGAYLAPEQLPGSRRDPDAQTDVFALGVIFYELLTGRRPFLGQGAELFQQIAQGHPAGPRSVEASVPKDLDTICMKCLEVNPRDRYQSAMDVYKELRLFLEDKPIQTKPPGPFARLARWFSRHRILSGLLLTFFLLALLGTGFVCWRTWQSSGVS